MKKAGIALICTTVLFAFFLIGFLYGRNYNHTPVQISALTPYTPSESAPTDAPSPREETTLPMININKASKDDLALLPGIGTVLAERIVAYRTANGPFQSIGDLLAVEGIGEKKLEAIRKHITIGG